MLICSVDLVQACNRMQLKDLLNFLNQKEINNGCIRTIQELNRITKINIKRDKVLSKIVPIATGIRKCDSISSTLFNIVVDKIFENVDEISAR